MRYALFALAMGCSSEQPPARPAIPADDRQLHKSLGDPNRIQITGKGVPLADALPAEVVTSIGLPLSGSVDVSIDLDHADIKQASGKIAIHCTACQIGDGKAKVHLDGGDLAFGQILFGEVSVSLDVANGTATITHFEAPSKDVALTLDGTVQLADTLGDSALNLCVRFRPTDSLRARDQQAYSTLMLTGAAPGPDGMFEIALSDRYGSMKRLAKPCGTTAARPMTKPVLVPAGTLPDEPHDVAHDLIGQPDVLVRQARLIPAIKDGQPYGFKVYGIRPDSDLARLGLQNGDTIVAVDDQPVPTVVEATAQYDRVKQLAIGKTFTLHLIRRNSELAIVYTIK